MSEKGFSVQEIKELMAAVRANGIEKLEIEQDDFELKIYGGANEGIRYEAVPQVIEDHIIGMADGPTAIVMSGNIVTSPIVGTFYEAAAPEKPAFVTVGSKVAVGDVLFIIESMKLMNEVTSDFAGTVMAIHVENGQGVEYGQPILTIE